MPSFEVFADPPIEAVEGRLGVDEEAMPRSCADQDVPLTVAMDAVARLQHRAAFRQSGVVADLLLFHAGLTRLFLAYADHFAPKLVAFHEAERVATPRFQAGLAVLQRVAHRAIIYNKVSLSEFTFCECSMNMYLHTKMIIKE